MSSILGVANYEGPPAPEPVIRRMLSAMSRRGADRVEIWREDGVALGVARYEWESAPAYSGEALVVAEGDHVVVADASLYYRDELLRRLAAAGVEPSGDTPSHLILAAYRAWGEDSARHIDGDFAFLVWDRSRRTLLASRDHGGMRPLHYAEPPGSWVVASTLDGVTAHPSAPSVLDLANVALDAAGLIFAHDYGTCYRGVAVLPAGATAARAARGPLRLQNWWRPRVTTAPRRMAEAADALRGILGEAVEQRLDPDEPTAIWLSGGWDSSAVFATAMERLAPRGEALRAISMSYEPGDSGREDERIGEIAGHWGVDVRWADSTRLPAIDISLEAAKGRAEPYAFTFDHWMRFLARETGPAGARTVLTGHGGNFLFATSPMYLADLLRTGRWRTLAREWRAMRVRQRRARHLFRWAVQPNLPQPVLRAVETLARRRLLGTYERPLPAWLRRDFVARHGLAERARRATPLASRGSRSAFELEWFMTHPLFPRVNALAFEATLAEGVEQRAPIYDPRVISFTAAGPWHERFSMGSDKLLLRRSMRGLLPDSVLAHRPGRTGTLASYVNRSMTALLPGFHELFRDPLVAELGIVDPAALRQDLERCAAGRGYLYLPEQILAVADVETWLRAHEGVNVSSRRPHALSGREAGSDGPAVVAGTASGIPDTPGSGGVRVRNP